MTLPSRLRRLLCALLLAGIVPLAMGTPPPVAAAEDEEERKGFFKVMQGIMEDDALDTVPASIAEFTIKALKDTYKDLKTEDVEAAVANDIAKLCNESATPDVPEGSASCRQKRATILNVVLRENNLRTLGHDLQAIASSYELPIRDAQRGQLSVTGPMSGVLGVWRVRGASSTAAQDPGLLIRTVAVDNEEAKDAAEAIKEAYDNVGDSKWEKEEQQRALVWRYNAGARLVRGDRKKKFPAPEEVEGKESMPERQYLFKRWENVESALLDLWSSARSTPIDPPLKKGEIAVFMINPEGLPPNVEFWGFMDGQSTATQDGDVGIRFAIPVEPHYPSLMKGEDANLGGAYPPEPLATQDPSAAKYAPRPGSEEDKGPQVQDGRILCASGPASRGYLCRAPDDNSDIECEDGKDDKADPNTILLTACKEKGSQGKDEPKTETLSGTDSCRDIQWQSGQFDPQFQCRLQLECGECKDAGKEVDAFASMKDSSGTIKVCMKDKKEENLATPLAIGLVYHELTHAYQFCSMPIGQKPYENDQKVFDKIESDMERKKAVMRENAKCCHIEGEAYLAQCQMLQEVGVISEGMTLSSGIPVNAETCMEIFRNAGCSAAGGLPFFDGCAESREYPNDAFSQLENALASGVQSLKEKEEEGLSEEQKEEKKKKEEEAKKEKGAFCSDIRKNLPDRVKVLIDTIEGAGPVCLPQQTTKFPNTIGNTMCFLGECVETSLETGKAIPGRAPMGVQDEAFPFDAKMTKSPGEGSFLTGVPTGNQFPPPYRPRMLVEQLDRDLCQRVGLPPQSPGTACVLATGRSLRLPLGDSQDVINSVAKGLRQQTQLLATEEAMSPAIGARIGTSLYIEPLRRFGLSLAELERMMERLLNALKSVKFPKEMCPVGNT